LSELRRWNDISGTRVEPGHRLRVAAPVYASRGSRSRRSELARDEGSESRRRELASAERSGKRDTGKTSHADPSTPRREHARTGQTVSATHRRTGLSAHKATQQTTRKTTHKGTTAHRSSPAQ
jgi:hypothetical protein